MRVRMTACGVMVAVLIAMGAPSAEKAPFSRFVVFGTSLSDPGNAFALAGGTNTPPHYDVDFLLVPQVPYARGGHHTTNGATWIEQLARARGLAGTVRPAFSGSDRHATNYAVAAARAREDGLNVNLSEQVDTFLARFEQHAPDDALYAIEMGVNDIRDAVGAYAAGGDGQPIIEAAIFAMSQNIQRLYFAGARKLLVWRVPNVGLTPAMRSLGPQAMALGGKVTLGFNAALDAALVQLSLALPGLDIMRLDADQLVNDIVAAPGAYGLSNVTSACITPDVAPFFCKQPDEYLFWDGIHPTRATHSIVAETAAVVLGLD